ncbi:uncharacterized protein LOC143076776 [Mytilus galloprovincialis]
MRVPGEEYERICSFHGWLIPPKVVLAFISFGSLFVFLGTVFLAVGSPLTIPGGILLAIGLILVLVSIALCLHSCFVVRLRDQETQTFDGIHVMTPEKVDQPDFIPTYAVIDKKPPPSPSSLKNGRGGSSYPKKYVTLNTRPEYQTSRDSTIPMQYYTSNKPAPPPYGYPNPKYPAQNGYANYDYPKSTHGGGPLHPSHGGGPLNQSYGGGPLHPSQPTPYSTLTQRDHMTNQPIRSGPQVQRSFSEDYDNTFDTTPMMSYSSHGSSGQTPTWRSMNDDIPEPQPLVYPSERRPMTFQQQSSSKMSIYDNVQFGLDKMGNE